MTIELVGNIPAFLTGFCVGSILVCMFQVMLDTIESSRRRR